MLDCSSIDNQVEEKIRDIFGLGWLWINQINIETYILKTDL